MYYEKFTNNPLKWLEEGKDRKYNLTEYDWNEIAKNVSKLFRHVVEGKYD